MISRRFGPHQAGFTLIELMTVVAIIAILATIAVPNYAEYIKRGRIVDATTRLADFRVRMEQYYLDNRTYLKSAGVCGYQAPDPTSSDSFKITCAADTSSTYVITATGQSAKSMEDFEYQIDQSGAKKTKRLPPKDWVGAGSACWVTRKDGSCQ